MLLGLAGLVLGVGVLLDDTGDDVGTLSVAVDDTPTADATPDDGPDDNATDTATAPEIGRSSALIDDFEVVRTAPPSRLALPSLGVDARVVPVGVDPDGLMTVPDDVSTVGWYRFGSTPADDQGTIVVAGHVDDREQGRGAFFDLRAIAVGDEVEVRDDAGELTTWRVTGRRTFEKESLPIDELYERTGQQRLLLITCGGDFDRAARSYESNVVVEAVRVA
jgi:LPXTG-site transpeptidase (sortase) family protein